MARLVWLSALVFGVMLILVMIITLAFDAAEIPKVVGAAFGAFVSGSVAILLFYGTQIREQAKSAEELNRLKRAHWLDTFITLPVVYEEWLYWRIRSGQTDAVPLYARSQDLIIEHLRSQFYEANLSTLTRIPIAAQTNLVMFHDNLRIVRERINQIGPRVEEFERISKGKPDFSQPDQRELLIEIAERSKELSALLQDVLLCGWAAQEQLDNDMQWRGEFQAGLDGTLPQQNPAWIGGVLSLRQVLRRGPTSGPQDDTQ